MKRFFAESLGRADAVGKFGRWIFRIASLPAGPVPRRAAFLQGCPTRRYRVLKTALRLGPRRALSSASGQNLHLRAKPADCGAQKVGDGRFSFDIEWVDALLQSAAARAGVALQIGLEIDSSTNCEDVCDYRTSRRNQKWPA